MSDGLLVRAVASKEIAHLGSTLISLKYLTMNSLVNKTTT